MPELLFELFSEEIPSRMQQNAATDLKRLVTGNLRSAGLNFEDAATHVTPCRLALVIDGLPARQAAIQEERRGPRADAPEKAIQGFLGSLGIARGQVEERQTPKGVFLFAVIERAGSETRTILPDILLEAVRELPWQKSMRWGRNDLRWVRPLHHVLAVFDGTALEGALELGGQTLDFTNETRGHRHLAPGKFAVSSFVDYQTKLRESFVVLDRAERTRIIIDGATALAKAVGLRLRKDPSLLDEVVGLIEWPVPLMGRIDNNFMEVPPESLVSAMRNHQKYFALETKDGALAPNFITVSNMVSEPKRDATIVAGNEKVLRARLSDAKFFWDQDRTKPLSSRVPDLAFITFYDRLGTLADKVARVEGLAEALASFVPHSAPDTVRLAAHLAKADLTTEMVGEFPELQGIMGRYYARHFGAPEEICTAIAEHYSPLGPADICPTAPTSVVVALADKIDTLVGFFAINERPTGSRDPFALRRAAFGVIRLVIENQLHFPLRTLLAQAYNNFAIDDALSRSETTTNLLEFLADRLKVHLREEGQRHDLISAVFALDDEGDLNRLIARVAALAAFLGSGDGQDLMVAYRRAANIVRIEEKKDQRRYDGPLDVALFEQFEEKHLHAALDAASSEIAPLIATDDFAASMSVLAELRQPMDTFFDQVKVNVTDAALRENRLRFLTSIVETMNQVADFSKVEG